MKQSYEMVIGLEVHVELGTKTKIFCGCSTEFGAEPNTHICPICLGFPGTMPVLNKEVVTLAIKAGLATDCSIQNMGKQDRKNYFYPDLPKAYQISQFNKPLCYDGHIDINTSDGAKTIRIERIHIEEDAGKLIHSESDGSMIDFNRGGVALIEIVSKPDMRSAEDAVAYAKKLRSTLIYAGVSDCDMSKGHMRCDVNLSIRKKGEQKLGVRVEMKNINSFNFVQKAIEYEFNRQIKTIEKGDRVIQETRRYDSDKNKTYSMRSKENAQDYRYFPDPDLAPIHISDKIIDKYKNTLPELPDNRKKKYIQKYKISDFNAEQIVENKSTADYFESAVNAGGDPVIISNLIVGEIFALISKEKSQEEIKIKPDRLSTVSEKIKDDIISNSMAKKILSMLWENDGDVDEIIEKNDMKQITDRDKLTKYIKTALDSSKDAINEYKNGKDKALQSIIGRVMRDTKGKASPQKTNELLLELIKNY